MTTTAFLPHIVVPKFQWCTGSHSHQLGMALAMRVGTHHQMLGTLLLSFEISTCAGSESHLRTTCLMQTEIVLDSGTTVPNRILIST